MPPKSQIPAPRSSRRPSPDPNRARLRSDSQESIGRSTTAAPDPVSDVTSQAGDRSTDPPSDPVPIATDPLLEAVPAPSLPPPPIARDSGKQPAVRVAPIIPPPPPPPVVHQPALTAEDLTLTLQELLPTMVASLVQPAVQETSQRAVRDDHELPRQPGADQAQSQRSQETEPPRSGPVVLEFELVGERGLEPRKHPDPHVEKLVDYRTYRLENKTQRVSGNNFYKVHKNLTEAVWRASPVDKVQLDEYPVSMFVVLRALADAANIQQLSEGDAYAAMPYALPPVAVKQLDKAKQGLIELEDDAMGFVGPVVGYCSAVQFLLAAYCSDAKVAIAARSIFDRERSQGPLVGTEAYRIALEAHADRFGTLIPDQQRKEAFLLGLREDAKRLTTGLSYTSTWAEIQRQIRPADLLLNSNPRQRRLSLKSAPARTPAEEDVNLVEDNRADDFQDLIQKAVDRRLAGAVQASSPRNHGDLQIPESPIVVATEETDVFLINESPSEKRQTPVCFLCFEDGHIVPDCPWLPPGGHEAFKSRKDRYLRSKGVMPRSSGYGRGSRSFSEQRRPSYGAMSSQTDSAVFDRQAVPSQIPMSSLAEEGDRPKAPKN